MRPVSLSFYVRQAPKPVLVLDFPSESQARLFRKGFRRAIAQDLQKFELGDPLLNRGATFATSWRFFALEWDLDVRPFVLLSRG